MEFERRPGRDTARDATPLLDEAIDARPVARIQFVVMDDPTTRWLAFLTGTLDIEGDIPRDNWDAVVAPDGSLLPDLSRRGIRMAAQPSLDCFYIGFNMDDPVVGPNRRLRQALNCAFDYAQWASLNPGRIDPATGPVPPKVAGRVETPFVYAFDLDRARALLAEAGYPEGRDPATGRRLTLQLELGRTDQETRESTELFAAFLDRVGVVLEANYNNWPAFLQKVGRREAQMFRVGWLADYPDAENFLQLFYSRNASPGPNRVNYVNPAFDTLYEEAMRTTDEPRRLDLYRQMQDIVREDCPWIFLYHRRDVVLHQPRIRNFRIHDFPYGMEKHLRLAE
jgi:ABC-type transport system substrate-binding protein